MPWKVYKESGKYCVHKLNADGSKGENVTCHPSPAAAAAHMKALYANTKEELAEEDMFFDVDDEAVKKFYREARKVSLSAKTYFVFTELSELEHMSTIDGMAAGSFTTMLGQRVSFPKKDLKAYVENTRRVLESTKDSLGNIVGLPVDMKGHDHQGGAGWIVGLELDEARSIIKFIVNWTSEGIRVVKENLSRFFSPSIDDKNKVILGGSLTNWPATRNDKGEILLRPVELSLSMKELSMSENNMTDVLEAIKNLPNTIKDLMSRKDDSDGDGGGEPQGLSAAEKDELKKQYMKELSEKNMSVQDLLQTPEAIEELGRKAQELAQQAIKAESRKMRAVEFAAEICGGTAEKPFGLPIAARDVVALLLSLPEAQANAVEKVLRQTHLNAIDFAQHGFDKMGFPLKPKLPEPVHSIAVNWVASGHTIEEFMKMNSAELGDPLQYDLTEFETRKEK